MRQFSNGRKSLGRLIVHDLDDEKKPSIIVVDSQNSLTDWLLHLDHPRLDNVVFNSPRNPDTPSINLFHLRRHASPIHREQAASAAVQMLEYLFEGHGLDLTGKGTLFEYAIHLLFHFPEAVGTNAVLQDFIDLMGTKERTWFPRVVARATNAERDFFENDYKDRNFRETKEQIRGRLQSLRRRGTLDRLFMSQENHLDFYDLLNSGAVVVIDTAKDILHDSSLYGNTEQCRDRDGLAAEA